MFLYIIYLYTCCGVRPFASFGSCCVTGPAPATSLAPASSLAQPPQRPWPLRRHWPCHRNVPGPCNALWYLFNVTNPSPDRCCCCCCWSHRTLLERCNRCHRNVPEATGRSWPGASFPGPCSALRAFAPSELRWPKLRAGTGAAGATGRSCKAAGRCNRCCWSHRTLL